MKYLVFPGLLADNAFYRELYRRGHALASRGLFLANSSDLVRQLALQPKLHTKFEHSDAAGQALHALHAVLAEIIVELRCQECCHLRYLKRLVDWDNELFDRLAMPKDVALEKAWYSLSWAGVQEYLQQHFPDWANLSLTAIAITHGECSKLTILTTTQDDVHDSQEFLIRAETRPQ